MGEPIWNHEDELSLVDGLAMIWWLDLTSPFGDAPAGVDWSIELPPGLKVFELARRPRFGIGPDAHRPHIDAHAAGLDLGFPGYLPAENHRRPMTHHRSWCDLHYPLVVLADSRADGGEVVIHRRAMGDADRHAYSLAVLDAPGIQPPPQQRRNVQPVFLPWLAIEEQEAVAHGMRRAGITDVNLNWYTHGMPLLPPDAYAQSNRILRREIPGVHLWIGGMPGADTVAPRAEGVYGRPIPFVASPEVAVHQAADLVVAAERTWCEATGADGVHITLSEPVLSEQDPAPPYCFSYPSRRRFARELGLPTVPDPMAILDRHGEEWLEFCCRQTRRLMEVARHGHGERPLALSLIGTHAPAAQNAPRAWREVTELADIVIYAHHQDDQHHDVHGCRWGHTRLGGMPQAWWEHWSDRLGTIPDPTLAVADLRMQLALSGDRGVRLWSWDQVDGRLLHQLMEWR